MSMTQQDQESSRISAEVGNVRWTESATEFYPPPTAWTDRLRSSGTDLALRAYLARDAMLKRIGRLDALGPGVHFVYLHHIFGDEVAPFRELLRRLSEQAEFLSHSDAVRKVTSGSIDRTYVSFSFDDGLLTCLESARILEEFDARGCYFVCPAAVDHCRDAAWIARWCRERLHKTPVQVMSWDHLEDLQRRGHEIGNHTMHHSNLAETPAASRPEEISIARDQLLRRLGAAAGQHFAWPYGEPRHIDPAAVRDILAAGHVSCSSAVRGVHLPGPPLASPPILLRNHAVFVRPVGATEFFMRRNIRGRLTEFRHQRQEGGN